ncbi:DUF4153 domain-containing protein [Herbaspirillum sp. SJZ107]|uniref:DUF4153 domain-containing protein n=1 Tax=Herbaspirillum sp. SJZ107 TaxID=2572881 RepID=UPI001151EC28|nr:DUF4153 domain-containing protein [Herbaspirillum sp. SJZ107]TQK04995.1 uncharacterized protein DUF4153 [Herbaspirillum sp. SJZ107]
MQAHYPADSPTLPVPASPRTGARRITLGLLQGLFLYILYRATQQQVWPATSPLAFAPMLLAGLYVPLIAISGLGHMDRRRLALWVGSAAVLLAGLACYDAWRVADLPLWRDTVPGPSPLRRSAEPSAALLFYGAAGLFIAHALVLAAVRDGRRIATYPTHFDIAWKLGVQIAFSVLFTGVTWLVLLLGAQLFELVKLHFLSRIMHEAWFGIPVTAFAFACAMHLTDVRPAIVRGIRGLLLVLLSWLLPVTVLLVGGFLAALPFTGLAPLWSTRHAAAVLLCAAAAFVILINAAWQQGGDGKDVARVVRVAARIAALLLAPLVLIAAYALLLRVRDYGWTGDRVAAAACILVAACYAAGYFRAGLRPGWLPALAKVNIAAAFVVIGVLLALFSPLLDPARISVGSQVARLGTGQVKADKFDFAFLRFDGARFGRAALDRLEREAAGADAALVRARIAAARALHYRGETPKQAAPTALDLAANLRMRSPQAALPDSFLRTDWSRKPRMHQYPDCLRRRGTRCDVYMLDLNGDGRLEVLVVGNRGLESVVIGEDAQGQWSALATVAFDAAPCDSLLQGLAAGQVRAVAPVLSDIEIGGLHGRLSPFSPVAGCKPSGAAPYPVQGD